MYMYIFKIIQSLDRNMIDREAVLVMMLFDNLSNNFNSIGEVSFMEIFILQCKYSINKTIHRSKVYESIEG